jgi:hypothetical protein
MFPQIETQRQCSKVDMEMSPLRPSIRIRRRACMIRSRHEIHALSNNSDCAEDN